MLREGARGLFGLGGESALVRVRPRSEALDVRAAFHDRPPTQGPAGVEPDRAENASPAEARPASVGAVIPEGRPAVAESVLAEDQPAVAEAHAARATVETPPADPAGVPLTATGAGGEEPSRGGEDLSPDGEIQQAGPSAGERQEAAREVAVEMVTGIIDRVGLEGEVRSRVAGGTVYVEVFGEEMGILIGRGGKTLEALQELVRAGVQRRVKARMALVVDVESYWERKRETTRNGPRRGQGRGGNR